MSRFAQITTALKMLKTLGKEKKKLSAPKSG
jgi:hypothetical protein